MEVKDGLSANKTINEAYKSLRLQSSAYNSISFLVTEFLCAGVM
ncbi:hypothetical protein S2091_4001 [Solimicrobium silvestre]|uniref:Uncharacterized protein n=1 Tax=Solimicrobium silvestre TaxID=2099400 RepID=A0A2S9GUE2_9BURK|nr:hypothetical protein S2091_4001 [Solimicrobium silvestre]